MRADGIDRIDAGCVAVLVEIGIAGNLQRVRQTDRAVAAAFKSDPAVEIMIAIGDAAAAIKLVAADVFPQTGKGGDDLESGAGRKTAEGAIDQRIRLVVAQRFPILRLDARDKSVRIERWNRSHREDVPIVRIDHHGRATSHGAQRFIGDRLDAGVDREVNIRALFRRFFPNDTVDRALRVTTHHADAGLAAQILVHRLLDVRFSLHVALIKGVFLRLFGVRVVRRADVA